MAGPGLPTSITAGSTGHVANSQTVHAIVNAFDTALKTAAMPGNLLAYNGTVWAPVVDSSISIIKYNGSTLPLRSTVTSDLSKPVFWASPLSFPPPSGGGYAVDGVDFWIVIP